MHINQRPLNKAIDSVSVKDVAATSSLSTSIAVLSSNTSVLASDTTRRLAAIYNEGTASCYLKLGSTASTTSYTLQIANGGYYEVPNIYQGAIDAVVSGATTAQLRVTVLF